MEKGGFIAFAFVALMGFGILVSELSGVLTGQYYVSGGGRWYYGAQKAQLSPEEACVYGGFAPLAPARVYHNEYGTIMSMCRDGNQMIGVPLVQTIVVP